MLPPPRAITAPKLANDPDNDPLPKLTRLRPLLADTRLCSPTDDDSSSLCAFCLRCRTNIGPLNR